MLSLQLCTLLPYLKLSRGLAAVWLWLCEGIGLRMYLHANVFFWKQFSEEQLVLGYSGIVSLTRTWGTRET